MRRTRGFETSSPHLDEVGSDPHTHLVDFEVRQVDSGDWQDLREIRLRALAQAPEAFASTLEREAALPDREWQDRARASGRADALLIVVGVLEPQLVGMALGVLGDDGVTNLYGVWVDPAYRRRGYGRQLVEWLIGWARAKGQSVLRLQVVEGNAEAIALYERMGFRRTGARCQLTSNPAVLEAEMLLPLIP